jgi:hypothetical protein
MPTRPALMVAIAGAITYADHDRDDGAKLGCVVEDVPTNDVVGRDDQVRRADQEARNERASSANPSAGAAAVDHPKAELAPGLSAKQRGKAVTHAPPRPSALRFDSLRCSPMLGPNCCRNATILGFSREIAFVLTAQHAVRLVHSLSFGASHIRR